MPYIGDTEDILANVQVGLGILIIIFPFAYHRLSRRTRRRLAAINYVLYKKLGGSKINLIREGVRIAYYTLLSIYGQSFRSRAFVSLIVSGLSVAGCLLAVSSTNYAAIAHDQKLAFEISLSNRLFELKDEIPKAIRSNSTYMTYGAAPVQVPVHRDERSQEIRQLIKIAESQYSEKLQGHPNQFRIAMLGLFEPPYWGGNLPRSGVSWLLFTSFVCDLLSVLASLAILKWTLGRIGAITAITGFSSEIAVSAAIFMFAMWSTGQILSGRVFYTGFEQLSVSANVALSFIALSFFIAAFAALSRKIKEPHQPIGVETKRKADGEELDQSDLFLGAGLVFGAVPLATIVFSANPNISALIEYVLNPSAAWPFYILMGSAMLHSVVVVLATGFSVVLHGLYRLSAQAARFHMWHFHKVNLREGMPWVLALLLYLEALVTLLKALVEN